MSLYLDDLALVSRLLRGDEAAFAELFESAFPRLYRFALARLGVEDMAQEAAQATLVRAIGKLATYRGEAALTTWLLTFCRHEIHALLSRRGGEPLSELVEDSPAVRAALEALAGEDPGPERQAQRSQLRRLVHVALDALPARYALALEWKYLEELPVAAIARRLELSEKAVESLLTRARGAFREAFTVLAEEGPR
jgi:RNA polymerase sigma-70 factor (ECF subfamily)